MSEGKKRRRLRINDDTMTTIVVWSLLFCVAVIITGIILQCFNIDITEIVRITAGLFGTELGICGLMTIYNRQAEKQDRRLEKREERRSQKEQKEKQTFMDDLKGEMKNDVAG